MQLYGALGRLARQPLLLSMDSGGNVGFCGVPLKIIRWHFHLMATLIKPYLSISYGFFRVDTKTHFVQRDFVIRCQRINSLAESNGRERL